MAYLTKKRNKYISVIRKWNGTKNEFFAYIPLKTDKKNDAITRHKVVEKNESNIKEGSLLAL